MFNSALISVARLCQHVRPIYVTPSWERHEQLGALYKYLHHNAVYLMYCTLNVFLTFYIYFANRNRCTWLVNGRFSEVQTYYSKQSNRLVEKHVESSTSKSLFGIFQNWAKNRAIASKTFAQVWGGRPRVSINLTRHIIKKWLKLLQVQNKVQ